MKKMIRYQFFDRSRDENGKWQETPVSVQMLECDAQAELAVNHLRDDGLIPTHDDGTPKRGLTIRRADAVWYSTGQ